MAYPSLLDAVRGHHVLVTGHTGFTGAWLCLWLQELGCEVTGLALQPSTSPNLYSAIGLRARLAESHYGDIRNFETVCRVFDATQPSIVFHLAAQPLVRQSYADPMETFSTNVIGTSHVLEAARHCSSVKVLVNVTTDKVYRHTGSGHPFVENDPLGGNDPYSASKACAELISRCYQETLADLGNGLKIANVRAGNIIGGGDWSADRIIPDLIRAATNQSTLRIRNPDAIRPWQHVLSACHGYLLAAGHLLSGKGHRAEAWNIGPQSAAPCTVRALVSMLLSHLGPVHIEYGSDPLPEAATLLLDASRATTVLGFESCWSTPDAVRETARWYQAYLHNPESALAITLAQLNAYRTLLGTDWHSLNQGS